MSNVDYADLIARSKAAAAAMLSDLDLPGHWTQRQRDAYGVRRLRVSLASGEIHNRWNDVRECRAVLDEEARRYELLQAIRKDLVAELLAPELQRVHGGPLRNRRDSLEIAIRTIDTGLTVERPALVPLLEERLREHGYRDGWDGFKPVGGPAGLLAEARLGELRQRLATAEGRLADAVQRAESALAEETPAHVG
jgi:hypothetical protein